MVQWRGVSRRRTELFVGNIMVTVLLVAALFPSFSATRAFTPLPFDPALSVSVSIEGYFHGYGAGQAHLHLTPTVTVYAPDEPFQMLEDELASDDWVKRVIQHFSPDQLPQGWVFFAPISDLTLHLTITDQQNRLNKVVVKDWNGQTLAEIPSLDGKTVSSSFSYDPIITAVVLEIWGKGSHSRLLARAVTTTPQGDDGFLYSTYFGFHPHPENPRRTDGVLAEAKFRLDTSYNHQETYPDNDSPDAKPERPKGDFGELRTKEVVKNTTDVAKAPPKLWQELSSEIHRKIDGMQTSEFALAHAIVPPFSREIKAIWQFVVGGEGYAWIAVPYYGKPERKIKVEMELGAKVGGAKPPPEKTSEVSVTWVAQLKFTLEEKMKWKVGDPIPIGDLWGIEFTSPPIFPQVSAKSILQEVTVQVDRDIICGSITRGSVTVEKKEVLPYVGYYTDPRTGKRERIPPPYNPPAPDSVLLDQNGVGKAQFPKGFRYIFKNPTLMTFPAIYEITPSEQTKDVPPAERVTFNAKLTNVAVLKVYVYTSKPDFLTTANVWLYKQRPDGSFPETPTMIAGTRRVQEGGREYEVAAFPNVQLDKQPDGTYRAIYKVKVFLALDIPHIPYEDMWQLSPTCEDIRSVTVQLREGQEVESNRERY